MNFDTLFSIAVLGAFIWAVRFLLPRAMKEHSALALTSAVCPERATRVKGHISRQSSVFSLQSSVGSRQSAVVSPLPLQS